MQGFGEIPRGETVQDFSDSGRRQWVNLCLQKRIDELAHAARLCRSSYSSTSILRASCDHLAKAYEEAAEALRRQLLTEDGDV